MEYAISAIVTALFLTIYILRQARLSPVFCERAGEDFAREASVYVRALKLPSKGSAVSSTKFKAYIKYALWRLKRKRYGDMFAKFIKNSDELPLKADFDKLNALPSVDGEPRMVKLARFCLTRSNCNFDCDKVREVLEAQNHFRTLSFCEIEAAPLAFKFAALEMTAYLYLKLVAVAKCFDIAIRYLKSGGRLPKRHKKLAKSTLFLSLCANIAHYKEDSFVLAYQNCMDNLEREYSSLINAAKMAESFDFVPYYTPLEIFDKYEAFSSAESGAKRAFLNLIGELSDKENLDEFLFAIRLDKYMKSASSGHMRIKRVGAFNSSLCLIRQKKDIAMLGAALSSHFYMKLYFEPEKRGIKRKSITKIAEYENSFEPIYKFKTINLGISTKNGRLKLSPKLPPNILRADIDFAHLGVKHQLTISRGEERSLFVNGTKLEGTDEIRLSSEPLKIDLVIDE